MGANVKGVSGQGAFRDDFTMIKGYFLGHEGALLERSAQDLVVHQSSVLVVEGRQAGDHLVDQRAQRPPVHAFTIRLQG